MNGENRGYAMTRRQPKVPHLFCWACACTLALSGAGAQAQWSQKLVSPTSLAFSPDGRWLAAGGIEDWLSPGDLRVWDAKNGKLRHRERYVYGVQDLAFSPDGKTLAVVTYVEESKGPIRFWNFRSWRVERTLGDDEYLYSIAYSPDGTRLVGGSHMGENGEISDAILWNIPKRRSRVLAQSEGLAQILFSPRGNLLLGGFYSGYYNDDSENLRAWDMKGRLLWRHKQPGLRDIAFLPDGGTFLAGIGPLENEKRQHGTLEIWDSFRGQMLRAIAQPQSVARIAVTRDGKTWATGDDRGTIRFWNARTRKVVKTLALHRDGISALAFSPDNHYQAGENEENRKENLSKHRMAGETLPRTS